MRDNIWATIAGILAGVIIGVGLMGLGAGISERLKVAQTSEEGGGMAKAEKEILAPDVTFVDQNTGKPIPFPVPPPKPPIPKSGAEK